MVIYCIKMFFWKLIYNMKVDCMPISCFIFSLFALNTFFEFLSRGIGTHIPILTGFQNGQISGWKNGHNGLNFEKEGHLHSNWAFFLLAFYRKCLVFQFLGCDILTHIPIVTVVQKRHITDWKMAIYC